MLLQILEHPVAFFFSCVGVTIVVEQLVKAFR